MIFHYLIFINLYVVIVLFYLFFNYSITAIVYNLQQDSLIFLQKISLFSNRYNYAKISTRTYYEQKKTSEVPYDPYFHLHYYEK